MGKRTLAEQCRDNPQMRALVIALRGDAPAACCACGEAWQAADLNPVSGGQWLCGRCYDEAHDAD